MNPIAVNSKYCNVFTENKRAICIIQTKEFGKVQNLEVEFIVVTCYFHVTVLESTQPVDENSGCPTSNFVSRSQFMLISWVVNIGGIRGYWCDNGGHHNMVQERRGSCQEG